VRPDVNTLHELAQPDVRNWLPMAAAKEAASVDVNLAQDSTPSFAQSCERHHRRPYIFSNTSGIATPRAPRPQVRSFGPNASQMMC